LNSENTLNIDKLTAGNINNPEIQIVVFSEILIFL
jgi:hypothetical protein